jgi:hypothetical protein
MDGLKTCTEFVLSCFLLLLIVIDRTYLQKNTRSSACRKT